MARYTPGTPAFPLGQPFSQEWGCAAMGNLPNGALIPGPAEGTGVNQAASQSTGVVFPSVGGTIYRFSLFMVAASIAVDCNWMLAVNGVASAMSGLVVAGGRVLELTTPLVIAPNAAGIELRAWWQTVAAALPGNATTRPKVLVSGYINPT